jgi:hypothetical protein
MVLPDFFHAHAFQLAAILVSAVLAGLLVAIVFAYPFLAVYRRRAVVVTWAAALLAAAWRAVLIGGTMPHSNFVLFALALEVLCLAVLPPAGVWALCTLTTHSSGRRSIACASYKRYGAGAAKFRR